MLCTLVRKGPLRAGAHSPRLSSTLFLPPPCLPLRPQRVTATRAAVLNFRSASPGLTFEGRCTRL